MIFLYLFMIITSNFYSNAQSVESSNTSKIIHYGDEKGWSISANIRNDCHFTFYFNCSGCSAFKDWAGLDIYIYFRQNIKTGKFAKHLEYGFLFSNGTRKFFIYGKYNLKYKNKNLFKTDVFSLEFDVIFEENLRNLNETIGTFLVNGDLVFGSPPFKKEYSCLNKLSDIRRTCHIFVNSLNYSEQLLEATIFFNYSQSNIYRSLFLTLIMQDFLLEIRSSDFKVVKVDENQWKLIDYGYNLVVNELIQTNLTLVSNNPIRNPIPLSVLLNDKILCGFYPQILSSSHIFGVPFLTQDRENTLSKEESYMAVHQNFVMLSIVIAFIIIFAIYAIFVTYQLIIWRRHYDQMTLELWNKVQSNTDNNFDNFVSSEYANAVTNYNSENH
ncbi:UNVERIFIED_CONTAM: hypothetical protein RMT77_011257 [Armadillidium vulgare]